LRNEGSLGDLRSSKSRRRRTFDSFDGLSLVADEWLAPAHTVSPPPAILLAHGGGQTRNAWKGTADKLSAHGWPVVSIDMRGHGESDWAPDENYSIQAFAGDLLCVARNLDASPIVVGASLGGIAAMFAHTEASSGRLPFSAMVLVDITPTIRADGVDKIRSFMREHLEEGFESLEEASKVISAYMPGRARPHDLSGLEKVLRQGRDGRYRWHWDPKFATGQRTPGHERARYEVRLAELGGALAELPVLLIRGRMSELVSEEDAQQFLKLVPHASYVDIAGAAHMVAGDRNDVFADALLSFVEDLDIKPELTSERR